MSLRRPSCIWAAAERPCSSAGFVPPAPQGAPVWAGGGIRPTQELPLPATGSFARRLAGGGPASSAPSDWVGALRSCATLPLGTRWLRQVRFPREPPPVSSLSPAGAPGRRGEAGGGARPPRDRPLKATGAPYLRAPCGPDRRGCCRRLIRAGPLLGGPDKRAGGGVASPSGSAPPPARAAGPAPPWSFSAEEALRSGPGSQPAGSLVRAASVREGGRIFGRGSPEADPPPAQLRRPRLLGVSAPGGGLWPSV